MALGREVFGFYEQPRKMLVLFHSTKQLLCRKVMHEENDQVRDSENDWEITRQASRSHQLGR